MTNLKNSTNRISQIEVCGVIASGKSTITFILAELGLNAVLEKFEINKFLQQFYENAEDHAFETEIAFLIQHYNHIKKAKKENIPFACDFSLLLDLAFADVTLSVNEKKVFMAVYNEFINQGLTPNVLIHLICDPAILMERIKKRGRNIEKSITIEYLISLDKAIHKRIKRINDKTKVITIDSETYDFVNKDVEYIKSFLRKEINITDSKN